MTELIDRLRSELDGMVLVPGDPGYDEGRETFYANFDRRPAVVVRPRGTQDVARALALVSESGVALSVRSGGHSPAGHSVADGGVVLDLSGMRSIEVDPDRRTAWADAGMTTGEYSEATASHGLATGFGDTPSVGVGGITLAGGAGYLVRRHGLAIDNLLAAEVVTADGRVLRADAENDPDLFWAIRGGGGNFGVATRLLFRLHPVDTILGGMLMLPATPEVIAGFAAEADAAPDDLSTIAGVAAAPPMPFVPVEHHGRPVILAFVADCGDLGEAERVVGRLRRLAPPLLDTIQPMPYRGLFALGGGPEGRPLGSVQTTFLDQLDEGLARSILERVAEPGGPGMRVVQLRVLGGAMARVADDATAFAHRRRRLMVNVAAIYPGTEDEEAASRWIEGTMAAFGARADGAYVGFLGDVGEEAVRRAYPGPTWERLRQVKRRYDPANIFRSNHNIPPA